MLGWQVYSIMRALFYKECSDCIKEAETLWAGPPIEVGAEEANKGNQNDYIDAGIYTMG